MKKWTELFAYWLILLVMAISGSAMIWLLITIWRHILERG